MLNFQTADLCDEHADSIQICQTPFTSFGKRPRFYGKIETVNVEDDNVLLVEGLEKAETGSVLVVNNHGKNECAVLGDRLASIALTRNLAGVIINGFVRDSVELANIDVGIFARGTYPLRSNKNGNGVRQEVAEFGHVKWKPGHYVYADEDGIIVSEKPLI